MNSAASEMAVSAEAEAVSISFAEFLESVPPSQARKISDIAEVSETIMSRGRGTTYYKMTTPELRLHCKNSDCDGTRIFRALKEGPSITTSFHNSFVSYRCSNCQSTVKTFSLRAKHIDGVQGVCYKFGELPEFGVPTPTKLLRVLGSTESNYFLKGRRCENNGLGIGAFTYYRRVVENKKNEIIAEIIKVAEKLDPSSEVIKSLKSSMDQQQFSKAVASIKGTLPQVLLINGHNPLTLLHDALSKGLHAKSDEECLKLAQAIRRVLAELAERIGIALKEEAELAEALSTIMNHK